MQRRIYLDKNKQKFKLVLIEKKIVNLEISKDGVVYFQVLAGNIKKSNVLYTPVNMRSVQISPRLTSPRFSSAISISGFRGLSSEKKQRLKNLTQKDKVKIDLRRSIDVVRGIKKREPLGFMKIKVTEFLEKSKDQKSVSNFKGTMVQVSLQEKITPKLE